MLRKPRTSANRASKKPEELPLTRALTGVPCGVTRATGEAMEASGDEVGSMAIALEAAVEVTDWMEEAEGRTGADVVSKGTLRVVLMKTVWVTCLTL